MAVIELTAATLEPAIADNDILIIDFWAPWCGPCRSFAPVFDAAAEKHPEIRFAKVNTEDEQELAGALNIRSIPMLMVFREQILIYSEAGALSASQLDQLLDTVKGLDMEQVRKEVAAQQSS